MKLVFMGLTLATLGLADQDWIEKNREYLAHNQGKKGVTTLPSGLQYEILESGPEGGPKPGLTQTCKTHYRGSLIDGKEFDSSYKRGVPTTFKPNQVIKGWTEALMLMSPGDKWKLTIPSELGYGMRGGPGPGGSVLVFELELVSVVPPTVLSSVPVIGPILETLVGMNGNMKMILAVFVLFQIVNMYFNGGSAAKGERVALSKVSGLASNPKVYLDVAIGDADPKRVTFELFASHVPKTAENFRCLCTGEKGKGKSGKVLHFKGSPLHRIIPRFMLQGGDITQGNGSGGESIYGSKFEDEFEKGVVGHEVPGLLSMANAGPNTNGSQFFITTAVTGWLDGKHVVFGRVLEGMDHVRTIEAFGSSSGKPKTSVHVVDSGELKGKAT